MVKTFQVGGGSVSTVTLDSTSLVVAVPVLGQDLNAVREQWGVAERVGADIVEWRVDALTDGTQVAAGQELREQFGLPVLYTVRRSEEGGLFRGPGYAEMVSSGFGWADLVDVEWASPERRELVQAAHRSGTAVIGSQHLLAGPVDAELLRQIVVEMAAGGADVAKVAWMVDDAEDLQVILDAQAWAVAEISVPTILIGMGREGAPTRVGGAARSSAFTFAVGAEASAPGQLSVAEVLAAD